MRLSMEEVQKMKNWFTNYVNELSELGKKVRDIFSIEEAQNLFDTIEALQQENNDWQELYYELYAGHSRLFKDFCKLQQENEQLRAQVARMREALDELTSELDYAHLLQNGIEWDKHKSVAFDKALDILNMKPIDYHNPADVEALRKAREAIQKAYDNYELIGEYEYDISSYLEEALAEIDRAIGGGQ